ncbi:DUF885 domain-containing protein [Acidipila sp. EB88]|nr:DUF885 domain-containing protein [Acidipila sp. EB88]
MPGPAAPAPERSRALAAVFNEIWQDRLEHSPEFATAVGDPRYNDRLDDESATAYNSTLERGFGYIAKLSSISTDGLSDQEKLSKDLMLRSLIEQQQGALFQPWQMPVNQFAGIQVNLPQLQTLAPFNTVKDYDDYIARMHAVPAAFQQVTNSIEAGIADHRVPPRILLEKVLKQTETLATQKAEDSPFARPLAKLPASIPAPEQARIRKELLGAITGDVLPAYARFAKFVEGTYIPAGRVDPGAWALPDGDAYYAFCVKQSTTTDMTPAQIHQVGLDEVARDEAEMLAIAKKLGFKDLAALRASVAADPRQHPASREALLAAYRKDLDAMRPKLPQYFGILPKAQLRVEPVPAYSEKEQAPAYYDGGTADGSRPGTIYINTYDFAHRSLANVESIAYHEGIPGHHLQISIAQELTGIPEFRKYTGYTAYVEGWGLYSEHLGKDMGFYQDPYSEYGRLETDIFRAVRLVVDTGVHSQHWTRQQMVDYFHAHTGLDEATVQAETDRYIAWPAQALGYKIGQLELLKLRAQAQAALGSRFDYRGFHDEVLGAGALPLDVLEARINTWIATQNHAQQPTGAAK